MPIRKKLSKRFNKTITAGPDPVPPLPSSLPLTSLPTFHPGLPLLEPSPRFSSSTNRAIAQSHRRSRSFSALTPPSRDFSSYRDSSLSRWSQYSGISVDQPWRSQDTWRALHNPTLPPSESSYGGLTHPSALPCGSGGWRSRAGEGFFATGTKTPRIRRKTLGEGEEGDVGGQGTLVHAADSPARGKVQYRIHPETPATSSPLVRRSSRTALPAAFAPKFGLDTDSDIESNDPLPTSRHQRNDSLLPPLLPSTIPRGPQRSSSFASMRSVRDSSLSPAASPGLTSSPSMAPIPWGRRTPAERRSASPTLPQTPQPRGVPRAPQRILPSPPMHDQEHPSSTKIERRYSGLSSVEEAAYDTEDEANRDGSVSPIRERLTTPVTPPQTGVPGGRSGEGMILPKRWDSLGKTTNPSRQASWGTLNSNQSRASRGGWI